MMKIKFLSMLLLLTTGLFSQDVIIRQNGSEIECKVLEITNSNIKYKEHSFLEGPVRNVSIDEVFMIIYESGKREKFSTTEVNEQSGRDKKLGGYYSVSAGFGPSYSGLGISGQYAREGISRFAIHLGIGLLPSDESAVSYSAGIQYYPWRYLYFDLQYGGFGLQSTTSIDPLTGLEERVYDRLVGPSLMIGYDWYLTRVFGFKTGLGLSRDFTNTDYNFSVDLGIVFKIDRD